MSSRTHPATALPTTDIPTVRLARPGTPPDPPPLPADPPAPPAARVGGDYELTRVLGRGGMGVVYLARHRGLKREVAYKVLTHVGHLDPETLGRFQTEAETLGRLQHSGIVQIFDYGTEDGVPFLAMEYVAGGSLADRLKAGRLPPREAAALVAGLAAAVGYAHAAGVVHRDLKPANILLTADGAPKVADFGLARHLASDHRTRTGLIAGTPTYMPPEQLAGTGQASPAVDVWAMGVLLYELLAGTVPFAGDTPEQILANILQHEPVPLRAWQPGLPRDLETVCRKCLHKDPHRRYRDGQELADDLDRFLAGRSILARPVGRAEKGWRWCRRNPAVAALAVGLAATLLAATGVSLEFAGRADRERAAAVAAAAAEAQLRQEAEAATAAEKAARKGADTLAAMVEGLFDKMGPTTDLRHELKVQMDVAAARLLAGDGDPLVRARLLYRLAVTRRLLGDWPEAVPLAAAAYDLRTAHLGLDHPLTCEAAFELGVGYRELPDRGADAVRVVEPAVAATTARLPPDAPAVADAWHHLALAYRAAGRSVDEAAVLDRLLADAERRHGPGHPDTEWRRVNLPRYAPAARNHKTAIAVLKQAFPILEADVARRPELVERFYWVRRQLGLRLYTVRKHRESLTYLRPAYEHGREVNGPDHPEVVADRGRLAEAYGECRLFADELPLRWTLLGDYTAQRNWKKAGWQLLRVGCGLAWEYLSVTPPPA